MLVEVIFLLPISLRKGRTRVSEWRGVSSAFEHQNEDNPPKPPPFIRGNSPILLAAIFLLASGLGILRYDLADLDKTETAFEAYVGSVVTLEGIIVDEPDVRETSTRYVLRTTPSLVSPSQEGEAEGARILLTVSHEPQFVYGDRSIGRREIGAPKNFTDEKTLREVDYISHLEKDGIFIRCLGQRSPCSLREGINR